MLHLNALHIPDSDLPPPPGTVTERRTWAIDLEDASYQEDESLNTIPSTDENTEKFIIRNLDTGETKNILEVRKAEDTKKKDVFQSMMTAREDGKPDIKPDLLLDEKVLDKKEEKKTISHERKTFEKKSAHNAVGIISSLLVDRQADLIVVQASAIDSRKRKGKAYDLFVVVRIQNKDGRIVLKKQTPVIRQNMNPEWNHSILLTRGVVHDMRNVSLQCYIRENMAFSELLGQATLDQTQIENHLLEAQRNENVNNDTATSVDFNLTLKPTKGSKKKQNSITGTLKVRVCLRPQDWAVFRKFKGNYGSFKIPPPSKPHFFTDAPHLPGHKGSRIELPCLSKALKERSFCYNVWRKNYMLEDSFTVASVIGISPPVVIRNSVLRHLEVKLHVEEGKVLNHKQSNLPTSYRSEIFERIVGSKQSKISFSARLRSGLPWSPEKIHIKHRSDKSVDSLHLFLNNKKKDAVCVAVERMRIGGEKVLPRLKDASKLLPVLLDVDRKDELDPSEFCRTVVMYSPFILLNRTSLKMQFNADAGSIYYSLLNVKSFFPTKDTKQPIEVQSLSYSSLSHTASVGSSMRAQSNKNPLKKDEKERKVSPIPEKPGKSNAPPVLTVSKGTPPDHRSPKSPKLAFSGRKSPIRLKKTLKVKEDPDERVLTHLPSLSYVPQRLAGYMSVCSEDDKSIIDFIPPPQKNRNEVCVLSKNSDASIMSYQHRLVHKVAIKILRPDSASKFSKKLELQPNGPPNQVLIRCRPVRSNELQVIRTERSQNMTKVVHKDTPGYLLGTHICSAPYPYERTSYVTITPRYILINKLDEPVAVRQHECPHRETFVASSPSDIPSTVVDRKRVSDGIPKPSVRVPFQWTDFGKPRLIEVRPKRGRDYKWNWSKAVDISEMGTQNVAIRGQSRNGVRVRRIVTVEVVSWNSNIVVTVKDHTVKLSKKRYLKEQDAPFRIENCTPFPITFHQKGLQGESEVLPPFGYVDYAWDMPTKTHEVTVRFGKQVINSYPLEVIKQHKMQVVSMAYRYLRDPERLLPSDKRFLPWAAPEEPYGPAERWLGDLKGKYVKVAPWRERGHGFQSFNDYKEMMASPRSPRSPENPISRISRATSSRRNSGNQASNSRRNSGNLASNSRRNSGNLPKTKSSSRRNSGNLPKDKNSQSVSPSRRASSKRTFFSRPENRGSKSFDNIHSGSADEKIIPWKITICDMLTTDSKKSLQTKTVRACLFDRVLYLQHLKEENRRSSVDEEEREAIEAALNMQSTRTQSKDEKKQSQVIRNLSHEESKLEPVRLSDVFDLAGQSFISLSLAGAMITPKPPKDEKKYGKGTYNDNPSNPSTRWTIHVKFCERAVQMQRQVLGASCPTYNFIKEIDLDMGSRQLMIEWLIALREGAIDTEAALEEERKIKMQRYRGIEGGPTANSKRSKNKKNKNKTPPKPKKSFFSFFRRKSKRSEIKIPHQSHTVWRVNLEEYGPEFKWGEGVQEVVFFPEVYASGPTRVLRLTCRVPTARVRTERSKSGNPKQIDEIALSKILRRRQLSTDQKLGLTSIFIGEGVRNLSVSVRIGGIGVSIIDTARSNSVTQRLSEPSPASDLRRRGMAASNSAIDAPMTQAYREELCYLYLGGISLFIGSINEEDQDQRLQLKIKHVQLDNNLTYAGHPVMLIADEIEEKKDEKQGNFVMSATRSVSTKNVMVLDYCDVKFARFQLNLDEYLLARLFSWSARCEKDKLTNSMSLFLGKDLINSFKEDQLNYTFNVSDPINMPSGALEKDVMYTSFTTRIYLTYLNLNKVEMTATVTPASALVADHPAVLFYRNHVLPLPGVDEAPLELNSLTVQHYFQDLDHLLRTMIFHYSRQFFFNVSKVVGSMDFLGNPLGMFSALGRGLFDFVADPYEGMQKNPREFGKGVAKGAVSLVTSSIGGVTNTASKITGTFGNAVAALSFDPEYLKRKQNIGKATGLADGILKGFAELGIGIVDGVTGVFRSPFQGAMKEGLPGFFKGAGRGLAGVVVKPVAGALGMVSQTTQGFRQTSRKAGKLVHRWGKKEIKVARVRPPKAFDVETSAQGNDQHYWIKVLQAKDLEAKRALRARETLMERFLLTSTKRKKTEQSHSQKKRNEIERLIYHGKFSTIEKNFFGKQIRVTKVLILTSKRLVDLKEAKEGVDRVYGTYRSDRVYDVEVSIDLKAIEKVGIRLKKHELAITHKLMKQSRKKKPSPRKIWKLHCGNLAICKKLHQKLLEQLEAFQDIVATKEKTKPQQTERSEEKKYDGFKQGKEGGDLKIIVS